MFFINFFFATLITAIISLAFLAFGLVMFLDAIKNKKLGDTEKLVWMFGMIITFPLMTVVYYFIARSSIKKKY